MTGRVVIYPAFRPFSHPDHEHGTVRPLGWAGFVETATDYQSVPWVADEVTARVDGAARLAQLTGGGVS